LTTNNFPSPNNFALVITSRLLFFWLVFCFVLKRLASRFDFPTLLYLCGKPGRWMATDEDIVDIDGEAEGWELHNFAATAVYVISVLIVFLFVVAGAGTRWSHSRGV
jgi:hypothetical protein